MARRIWDELFGTTYEQVGGGASDYSQYDPGGFMAMLQAYLGGMGGPGGGAAAPTPTDPYQTGGWFTDFQQNWGNLSGLVGGQSDRLREQLLTGSDEAARRAGETVASQFAGSGASGARDAAIARGMADPFAQAAREVALNEQNMLAGLGGQAMGLGLQSRQYADQSSQGWAGLGLQSRGLDLQRDLGILDALLGAGGTYSTLVAPTYAGKKVIGAQLTEYLLAGLGAAMS